MSRWILTVISYGGDEIDKDNFSAKVNLLPENSFDMPFLPAISVGVIHKSTLITWSG